MRVDSDKQTVLIVDDDKTNIGILLAALRSQYNLGIATSGHMVFQHVETSVPDLILLDIMMPDMDGYQVCTRLKSDERTKDIPIIFVTAMTQAKDKAKGLELGAVDYISKPFDVVEVRARVKTHLALKRARDELMVKERKLRSFINTLTTFSDALLLLDTGMDSRFVNPAAEKILGELRDQSSLCRILGPMALGRAVESELEKKTGERIFVEIRVMETEWEGETAYLAAIRDISERKKAEEEARLHQQQLVQADKMASIGILSSGVAHEINNPNGVIMLNASLLQKTWNDAGRILEEYYLANGDFSLGGMRYSRLREKAPLLFDQVLESSKRIKRIVAELKRFARKEIADLSHSVQINDVLKSAISLVGSTITKSTTSFEARFDPDAPVIKGSFQRLEQVLINLLINACQALADNTRAVSVSTSHDRRTSYLCVTVEDEGIGISQADLNHVFDPFFTTKRSMGGTGLGLYVSKGIVEEHGGRLELTSALGQGTTAVLTLPVPKSHE